MNKIYKVIWNTQLGCWQAVSELAKNHTSSQSSDTNSKAHINILKKVSRSILFGLALLPLSIHAAISNVELPTGAQINSGSANFTQNNNTLNINQNSQNLSTNWNTFNIGQDATVNFNQPNQSSTAINHVLDSNASQIMGRLNANGQVFLLNPNGVVFSKTAQVNVGGIVASTLNLNDADIYQDQQNGKYTLKGDANSTGVVENHGTINTLSGGTVALIAPNVKNTGTITTPNGTTHLTSASQVTLALQDGSLTQYQVDQGVFKGLVDNGGAIIADNGAVYLTAKAKDSLSKAVVNHTGIIEANRLTQNAKGEIILLGDMQYGATNVSGTLKAEGKNGADGGFIESSAAKVKIADEAQISTLSKGGKTGTWLIDPTDYTIAATGGDITGSQLSTNLASNNITIKSIDGTTGTAGNVNVNDSVTWNKNRLTLNAQNNININAILKGSATAGLALEYGQGAVSTNNSSTYNVNAPINLASTGSFTTKLGSDGIVKNYTIITSLGTAGSVTGTDLQGINGSPAGNYVLGADIDASGTVNWDSGAGFNPIGSGSSAFSGVLDGLNHTISGLTINRPIVDAVGLIGRGNSVKISNIGLVNSNIIGSRISGVLAGYLTNNSSIINSYTTGKLTSSSEHIGGILGGFEYGNTELLNSYSTVAINGNGLANAIGGLIGSTNSATTINNSYFAGTIENGNNYVGGILGSGFNNNLININNSYVIGAVKGITNTGAIVGGGYNTSNLTNLKVNNSFWNTETTGQNQAVGNNSGILSNVLGLTTIQLFDKNNFTGFDFNTVWGNGDNQTTPYLLNMANNQVFNKNDLPTGAITSTNRPALFTAILNVNQLQNMNQNLSGNYLLGNNIDASDTVNWNSGAGFNPIGTGNLSNPNDDQFDYLGKFDGLGHVIDGLYVNRDTKDYGGLFGRIGNSSEISNVGLTNGSINGLGYLGGIVGRNHGGTIDNVYSTNKIIGTSWYIGGIAGENNGIINNVYSTGNVQGYNNVGGLVGLNSDGTITNSYSTGAVNGGGLIGAQNGTYQVINSFWNTETTGQSTSAGGIGLITAQMQNLSTFTGAGWSISGIGGENTIWRIYDGQTAPLLRSFLTALTIKNDDTTTTYNGKNQGGGYQVVPAGTVYDPTLILSQQKNATPTAVNIDLNKNLYSVQQGYDLIVQAGSGTGTLIISPAALTITANDKTKTYGDIATFTGTEFTSTGLQNGETVGSINLGSAGASVTAGVNGGTPYAITASNATGGTFDANNYTITYNNGKLIVAPRKLIITANDKTKTYGDTATFTGTEFTSTGLQNGETVGSINLGSAGASVTAGVNGGTPYAITASNATGGTFDANNYTITYNNGKLIVAPRKLIITANDKTKTYGDTATFTGTEFTSTGLQNGETVGSINLGSAGASVTAGVNGGTPYAITASNATGGTFDANNYTITYNNGKLIVAPRKLIITANDKTKTYGDIATFTGTEFNASGLQNGETVGSINLGSAGASVTAGVNGGTPYAITASNATGGTFDANNYTITYNNGKLIVAPRKLIITANDKTKTYGDTATFTGTEFTSTGLQNGETVGSINLGSAGASVTAGVNGGTPYAITASNATGGTFDANNYTITYNNGKLIVAPRKLIITANDKTKTYGDTATFTGTEFTSTGLQNGETVGSVNLGSAGASVTAGVNGGTPYAITAGGATGGTFDANNYTITYNNGKLIVAPRSLTITANDKNKTYGDTTTFTGTEFSASGLQNGETVGSVNLGSAGASATAGVNGGTPYTITAGGATGGTFDANNYTITYVNGKLIVAPRKLIITANDKTKTYGDTTSFAGTEFTASGLQNGETVGSVNLGSVGASATAGVNGGTPYAITAGGATGGTFDANYTISYNNGNLIVSKKDITVTANSLNSTYNGKDQTATGFTATGLVNGETEAVLSGVTASVTGKNAGSYTNTATGLDQNYDLTFVDGSLNIAKAKINQVNGITADNRVYDATSNATLNTTSAQFDGIVAGDQLTVATATGTFADKNVGTAKQVAIQKISLTGADVANYELINNTAQTTADINKANINNISGIAANSRIYDGLTNATLNTANAQFNGVYAGDQLTVASATGQFENATTGQAKTVAISGLSLGGIDAQNYNLVDTTALTQANINMLTPATYLQAIQFKRPSYLPKDNRSRNTVDIEVSQGGVNTSGIQTLAGEH